ncbi:CbrC family protein [Streptomyces sp. NRRL F-4428]|uniref:CbrC family protein n=1 Tax=Streptomyces sp. NRRL F-4428 TaxID=1609137 RepID=UPI000A48B470
MSLSHRPAKPGVHVSTGGRVAFPDAREELRSEAGAWGWSAEAVESYLAALDKDSQPTGYLFMCRTCGRYMAYADST